MSYKISNKTLAAKAAQLAALQAEAAALADQIDALKTEITSELARRDTEELTVPGFLIRWTRYESSRFDGKAFKKDYPTIAEQYTRPTEARRFTLSAN